MTNFVFVYYDQPEPAMSAEEAGPAWMAWFQQLGDKLVDGGNPFKSDGKAVEKSGVTTIENYPATGYSIVKADSLDEAVELAKGCPLLVNDGPAVRVYETLPM